MRAGGNRQGRPAKTGEWSEELEILLKEEEAEEEEEEEAGEDEEGGGMLAGELDIQVGAPRTEGHVLMPASSREALVYTNTTAMHPMYCSCMHVPVLGQARQTEATTNPCGDIKLINPRLEIYLDRPENLLGLSRYI